MNRIVSLPQAASILHDDLEGSERALEEVMKVLSHAWMSPGTSGVRLFWFTRHGP